jgi:hypothetical protein
LKQRKKYLSHDRIGKGMIFFAGAVLKGFVCLPLKAMIFAIYLFKEYFVKLILAP